MDVRSRLLHFFPVPPFLLMPAASLSVSDEAVRFIELQKGRTTTVVKEHAERQLSPETVTSGDIQDTSELLSTFKEVAELHGNRYVTLSLPEEKGYIYTTHVPGAEGPVTEEQVAFTLEKNVPFAVNEVVFDFVETGEGSEDGKEVVVMVMPTAIVEKYINVIKDAGLFPISFEVESRALARAVVNKDDPRTHLLVHIQKNVTNISVISRNIPRFTSTVHTGSDSLAADSGSSSGLWLKEEVERVRSYWHSHGSQNTGAPQTVILCGEGVEEGIEKDVLTSQLDIEVVVANVWENVASFDEYVPDIPKSESLRFGVVIGLALKELERRF